MTRLALVVLLATGCVAHAGVFVGVRSTGRISYGWQAAGGTILEVGGGQSIANGKVFTHGDVHVWFPVHTAWGYQARPFELRETQIGATIGVGDGAKGTSLVVGADAAEFAAGDDSGEDTGGVHVGGAVLLGIRRVDGEFEVYVGAELRRVEYQDGG